MILNNFDHCLSTPTIQETRIDDTISILELDGEYILIIDRKEVNGYIICGGWSSQGNAQAAESFKQIQEGTIEPDRINLMFHLAKLRINYVYARYNPSDELISLFAFTQPKPNTKQVTLNTLRNWYKAKQQHSHSLIASRFLHVSIGKLNELAETKSPIATHWNAWSINTLQFLTNMEEGKPLHESAMNTWSGKLLSQLGYSVKPTDVNICIKSENSNISGYISTIFR